MCKDAWDWYEANAPLVTKVVHEFSRGDSHLFDDLWEEVIRVLPGILDAYAPWHPSGASLTHYVAQNLRLYLWKYRNRLSRRRAETIPLCEDCACRDLASRRLCDADEVDYIMRLIGSEDARLLVMRFAREMTYEEIGWEIDVCRETARKRVKTALERARERVREATIGRDEDA